MKKTYEAPSIVALGSLKGMTLVNGDKTPGSPADFHYPKGSSFIFS